MTTAARLAGDALAPSDASLALLRALFARLHAEGVSYCHWKSNEHLAAALTGETDLDLLVDRRCAPAFARALADLGFKRFAAVPANAYPGVEDYLGLDADTGALTHLHVHWELTLGEQYLKGYRLPWEGVLLSTRRLDDACGVYRADPHAELLLLVVRAALKLRWRDLAAATVRRRSALTSGMLRELRWLAPRVSGDTLVDLARDLLGAEAAGLLPAMVTEAGPSLAQLVVLRRRARPSLSACRTYSPLGALRRRWMRELATRWRRLWRRVVPSDTPTRRVVPRGGVLIALVGADGAGKSTLAGEIADWLGRKLDVVRIYGGSGKGSAALPRRVLERAAALARRLRGRRGRGRSSADASVPVDPAEASGRMHAEGVGRAAWVLALARERRRRAARARRARNRGLIVLSDRFPQSQVARINDGPRLTHWLDHRLAVLRAVARYEMATFREAERCPPDLVVRLHVSFDVARRRKPDTPPEQLRRKLEIVRGLRYPAGSRVVDVDASRPLERVLLDVKRAVWESL